MNKTTAIAIASFFIIGLIVGSELHGCKGGGGRGTGDELVHTDTLVHFLPRIDTIWHTVQSTRSIPYRVWGHDTVYAIRTERIIGLDTSWLTAYQYITDTAVYADTLREQDAFKAEIFDTLYGNRIMGRSVRWADLTPIEVRSITNTVVTKAPLVKVYIGAEAYGGKSGSKVNVDVAPAASLVFADRYMLDLGYYIFNEQATAGLKVRIGR